MSSEIKEISQKAGIFFVSLIIGQVIAALYGIVVGSILGADIYGQYSYILSFFSLFVIFSKLGLKQGLFKFIPKYKEQKQEQKARDLATFSLVAVSIISLILTTLISVFNKDVAERLLDDLTYNTLLLKMAPVIVLICLQDGLLSILRANKYIKSYSFFMKIFIPLSKIICFFALTLVFKQRTINLLIYTLYISLFITILLLFQNVKKYNLIGGITYHSEYREVVWFSIPLLFSGIIGTIILNVDQFMIGYFLDDTSVGAYRMALQLAGLLGFSTLAVNAIYTPVIAELYHKGEHYKIKSTFKIVSKWIVCIDAIIFGALLLFSSTIMEMIGKSFVKGTSVVVIIAFGKLIGGMFGTTATITNMTGRTDYDLKVNIVTVGLNIVLNYFLISVWGVNGAAIATMTSFIISSALRAILLYKHMKIYSFSFAFMKIVMMIGVACVITYYFNSLLNFNDIMQLIICGSIYLICILGFTWMMIMNQTEKKQVIKQIKRFKKA